MTKRSTTHGHLTELQKAILDFVWKNGSATSEQIREGILPAHRLKDSSVRTLLRRLEARGLLNHTLDGKTFLYRAAVRPYGIAAGAVRSIIDRFCAGSVEQFLLGMVDEKVLTMKEIERLTRRVKSRK